VNECGNYNKVVEKIIESESACASKEDLNASQDSINTKNKKEELYHTGTIYIISLNKIKYKKKKKTPKFIYIYTF